MKRLGRLAIIEGSSTRGTRLYIEGSRSVLVILGQSFDFVGHNSIFEARITGSLSWLEPLVYHFSLVEFGAAIDTGRAMRQAGADRYSHLSGPAGVSGRRPNFQGTGRARTPRTTLGYVKRRCFVRPTSSARDRYRRNIVRDLCFSREREGFEPKVQFA
jgi:hypothetical protein